MADNKKPVVRLAGQTRAISELGYDALSLWEKYGMVDQALRGQKSYERTFVPGESELTRRLLGLPEEFEYSNIRTADERDFKEENLKIIPGTYNVVVSSKLLSKFTSEDYDLTYYIALEPDSTFE